MTSKKRFVHRPKIMEKYLGSKAQKKSHEVIVSMATGDSTLGQVEVILEHKTKEGKYTPAYE